jgi:hypothetical protein
MGEQAVKPGCDAERPENVRQAGHDQCCGANARFQRGQTSNVAAYHADLNRTSLASG